MAGLSMASSLHWRSASMACAMNSSRSMPTSAAGSRPNTDSAEKRPPTVGWPENTAAHPSSRAWRSSMEPGSVMATRCCTSSSSLMRSATASRTARKARRGSMVPPLFDEITNSVVSGFASAKMARTRTGESESSVLNVIFDESGLLYFVMVMGACVEPPWPMSTTVFSPWAMIESAKFWMSRREYGELLARSVHPMYCSEHARASSEKSYRLASLAWIRLATQSFTRAFAEGYSFSTSPDSIQPSFSVIRSILANGDEADHRVCACDGVVDKACGSAPENEKRRANPKHVRSIYY